ncbi:type II toxin-antitoxin system VapC family toxin [Truepera radiovictrix]|uniref:Ribonuclease VapC n=1 Tax=Truepera radiovictrix (strain DSM 17093 / CIP 108686 / LMG 22925 / RQ-24) TaxID=649638 RepID=D7CX16_TRURR|nr:type II toxin-antitoxin system VapC family toxin [Truepera radiovictrix]ADI14524.1 PIN domain protein family protein [Truepera radiovictrix DSM 17093]WMT56924.1 type II toxin-antitoxin system VapC family toxin [Truepera radiovictrix]
MILIDANLLIYAHVMGSPQHHAAHAWLDAQLSAGYRVGLPWPSLLAFLRLTTNPRVFERPLTAAEAWAQVEAWLSVPSVWLPTPTAEHPKLLRDLVTQTGATANLIPDAHLAALALEHGLTLCSTDGDFGRFPRLKWRNPLAEAP